MLTTIRLNPLSNPEPTCFAVDRRQHPLWTILRSLEGGRLPVKGSERNFNRPLNLSANTGLLHVEARVFFRTAHLNVPVGNAGARAQGGTFSLRCPTPEETINTGTYLYREACSIL